MAAAQSVCGSFTPPNTGLHRRRFRFAVHGAPRGDDVCRIRSPAKSFVSGLRWATLESQSPKLHKLIIIRASDTDDMSATSHRIRDPLQRRYDRGYEIFRGKSGSVSFYGMTHQSLEQSKLVSAPIKLEDGSLLWLAAPAALISSLLLPSAFVPFVVDVLIKNEVLAEIVASLATDAIFYAGVAAFLLITDRVQRPYLQFSAKRWGLITELNGYLTSTYLITGFNLVSFLVVSSTWTDLGLQSFAPLASYFSGIMAQISFEIFLDRRGSSCWPLVPIIFEVYRIYQLTRASEYIQRLMFEMRNLAAAGEMGPRSDALLALFVNTRVLGIICLWSLLTFLLRLFPSRPVRVNY